MRDQYPTSRTEPEIVLNRSDIDWIEKRGVKIPVDVDYTTSLTLRPILALKEYLEYRGIKLNWDIGDMNDTKKR